MFQVFLPGWDTISKLNDMLNSDPMFRSQQKYLIIPLHSMMPTAFQQQVKTRALLVWGGGEGEIKILKYCPLNLSAKMMTTFKGEA